MSFFDWLGRVIMLALAGMITLSIIGAIAAIPNGIVPQQLGFERPFPPTPQPEAVAPVPPAQPGDSAAPDTAVPPAAGNQVQQVTLTPAAPQPADAAKWLEVIAYTLLALAGLGTLAILLLWWSLRQRRRIANALEALAARG